MVLAGCIISPAFCANSVSPRVSDTIITPNFPPRTRLEMRLEMSEVSAAVPRGDVHDGPAGARLLAGVTRALLEDVFRVRFREDCAYASPLEANRLPASATATRSAAEARARGRRPGRCING